MADENKTTNPRQKALDELARITQEELGGYEVTDNPLDRSQTTLKQPFTDKLMDDVLRGMSDLELELICQRDELQRENRALRQALTWCVVNDGETLFDHPKLLERFRQILGLEDQP